ncbi:MAG: o-succinylbenzoate synthase, partial [Chitinophagales bacterium]
PDRYLQNLKATLENIPSVRFGLEMAERDLKNGGRRILFLSNFTEEKAAQQINGLIWMGEPEYMLQQIQDKLDLGFSCLKLKIGALDFEKELALLKNIRAHFSADQIEIRVDANGAFSTNEAFKKLERLANFDLHSIEQPIAPGQWDKMQELCKENIIDIALDEELIGVYGTQKKELLEQIQPQYLILKPSMLGGFLACEEWIDLAKNQHIGWWATSALESNIGLSAIAQWTATKNNPLPQGLGTGQLYNNNFDSPLYLKGDQLHFSKSNNWDLCKLDL